MPRPRKKTEAANAALDVPLGGSAVEANPEGDKIKARIEGRDYSSGPTLQRFHASNAFIRFVRGPVGSGKTTGGCEEIMTRARQQMPWEGIRRTRWAVIRNTYGMLKDTSVKTWLEWFPEDWFGKFNRSQGEMKHHIKIGDIDCEVLFRALDGADDVKKLLSLELTGAFVNEVREMPKEIIDALTDRVGRFPPMRQGGPTWRGIFGDTNPPDEDHWYFELERNPPEGWEFFVQPGGLINVDGTWKANPQAENLANLEKNYYVTRAAGKREDHVKVYYGNEFGFVGEGKPVFPEYADHMHAAKTDLALTPSRPVFVGIGLALNSAAVFGQKRDNGQWVFLDEMMLEYGGAVTFAEQLSAKMQSDFPARTPFRVFTVKPDKPDDSDSEAIQIMRGRGIFAAPCRTNDVTLRREAVAGVLSRLIQGDPGLLVSPKCKLIRKALAGGYSYARIQNSGEERYHDEPTKNRYSAIAEAAQFLLVGGGEAAHVFQQPKSTKLKYPQMGVV